MLLGDIIKNSSFLKFVVLKCISFSDIMDCACKIFDQKVQRNVAFLSPGVIFKSSEKFLKLFQPVELHFY